MSSCRLFALPLLLALTGPALADEVRTLSGNNETGVIVSINAGQIVLNTKTGAMTIPLAQVLEVYMQPVKPIDASYKYTDVVLTDDTVLHCRSIDFQNKDVELTLLSGAVLKVPLTSVMSFVREANNPVLAQKFKDLVEKKKNRDRIVILRDGNMSTLEGTLGEVKGPTISFRPEQTGKDADITLAKLHGIIFFRTPISGGVRPICKVNDIEGNTLTAVKLTHDGARVTMTTTSGNELVLPHEVLANLDYNIGKLNFLSGMVPIKFETKARIGGDNSGFERFRSFARDTNPIGQKIVLDNKTYVKGLSMYAYSDLEYNLGAKFKEFTGVLFVDPRVDAGADPQAEPSQPKVTIYCDNNVVFTGTITGKKVQPLKLNVNGVRTLRIVVSSENLLGSIFDTRDHVTLAEGQVSQ